MYATILTSNQQSLSSSSAAAAAAAAGPHGLFRLRIYFFWIYGIYEHLVRLLGRGISPTQGLYLHRTTQHRKTRTHIHASNGIRTRDPSVRGVEDSTCLRPRGHWDRQYSRISTSISHRMPFSTSTSHFCLAAAMAITCDVMMFLFTSLHLHEQQVRHTVCSEFF
jgi:hypothetical protein